MALQSAAPPPAHSPVPAFYGAITDEPFPIAAVPDGALAPAYWRQEVPDTMVARRPELAPYSVANGGMDAGPGNPLGARALCLFQNGVDTLYRIHGNAAPKELGRAVSSGCIRMLDQDVIHLHDRAVHGASVIVLPSIRPAGLSDVYEAARTGRSPGQSLRNRSVMVDGLQNGHQDDAV